MSIAARAPSFLLALLSHVNVERKYNDFLVKRGARRSRLVVNVMLDSLFCGLLVERCTFLYAIRYR